MDRSLYNKDFLANMFFKSAGIGFQKKLHRNFEIGLESAQIEESQRLFEFDQKIEVAPIRVFAPDHGAKNAHIPRMMVFHDGEHLVSVKKNGL